MLGNPIPGTTWAHCGGYDADSGLDILVPSGTPVYTPADGVVEYAERGHTPWEEDTSPAPGYQGPHSIRIRLAHPIVVDGVSYPWIWYTHMTEVAPAILNKTEVRVEAGTYLGRSGIGNRVPHLHFGIIADRAQAVTMPWRQVAEQIWGRRDGTMPPSTSEPAHPVTRKVKVFAHSDKRNVVVDGQTYAVRNLLVNGQQVHNAEIVVEY